MSRSSIRVVSIVPAVLLVLFAAGCHGDDRVLEPEAPAFGSNLLLTDAAGQESSAFHAGEPVTMVFTLTNLTRDEQRIDLRDSQIYDFEVVDPSGRVVWNWAHGRPFLDVLGTLRFRPFESKVYTETWDQTDNDRAPVAAGQYRSAAFVVWGVPGTTAREVPLTVLPPKTGP